MSAHRWLTKLEEYLIVYVVVDILTDGFHLAFWPAVAFAVPIILVVWPIANRIKGRRWRQVSRNAWLRATGPNAERIAANIADDFRAKGIDQ